MAVRQPGLTLARPELTRAGMEQMAACTAAVAEAAPAQTVILAIPIRLSMVAPGRRAWSSLPTTSHCRAGAMKRVEYRVHDGVFYNFRWFSEAGDELTVHDHAGDPDYNHTTTIVRGSFSLLGRRAGTTARVGDF